MIHFYDSTYVMYINNFNFNCICFLMNYISCITYTYCMQLIYINVYVYMYDPDFWVLVY